MVARVFSHASLAAQKKNTQMATVEHKEQERPVVFLPAWSRDDVTATVASLIQLTRRTLRAEAAVVRDASLKIVTDESVPRELQFEFEAAPPCGLLRVHVHTIDTCEKPHQWSVTLGRHGDIPRVLTELMQKLYWHVYDGTQHRRPSEVPSVGGRTADQRVAAHQDAMLRLLNQWMFIDGRGRIQPVESKEETTRLWHFHCVTERGYNHPVTIHLPRHFPCEHGEMALDFGDMWLPLVLHPKLVQNDPTTAVFLALQRAFATYENMRHLSHIIHNTLLTQLHWRDSASSSLWASDTMSHRIRLLDSALKQTAGTGVNTKTICIQEDQRTAVAVFGWSSHRIPVRVEFTENEWIIARKPMWRQGAWTWKLGTAQTWWLRWHPFVDKHKPLAHHLGTFLSHLFALLTLHPTTFEWQTGDEVDVLDATSTWRRARISSMEVQSQAARTRIHYKIRFDKEHACSDEWVRGNRLAPHHSRSQLSSQHISAGDAIVLRPSQRCMALAVGSESILVLTHDPSVQRSASHFSRMLVKGEVTLAAQSVARTEVKRRVDTQPAPSAVQTTKWLNGIQAAFCHECETRATKVTLERWTVVMDRTCLKLVWCADRCATPLKFQITLPHDPEHGVATVRLVSSQSPTHMVLAPSRDECRPDGAKLLAKRLVDAIESLATAELTFLLANLKF